MFERFTEGARRVVTLAQEEGRGLNHNYIGTEHILLGLLGAEGGIATRALTSLDVDLDRARRQVETIIGRGVGAVGNVHLLFTPRAKKVLELSLRQALQLGDDYIGTEHILLGLIEEGKGVAAQVLAGLGVRLSHARQRVLELRFAGEPGPPPPTPVEPTPVPAPAPADAETTSAESRTRVFVSYRRRHDSHVAGRIADWLDVHLGQNEVFMDVDSITLGVDFVAAITEAVASCDVLLAVIGSEWATMTDVRGQIRLEQANDLVRLEIEAALRRDVRVIPVLVDDAEMPSPAQLPESVRSLAFRHGLKIRHDSFRQDIDRLARAVRNP